jgi:hypothetical protein
MPTTTTWPTADTISTACARTPASPPASTTRGGPSPLVQSRTWVLDDRGHLVALDPGVEVADAEKRAHVTGKQVKVGAADTDRFGPDDNVPGPGAARSGDVLDHHLAR